MSDGLNNLKRWAGREVENLLRRLPPELGARAAEVTVILQANPTRRQVREGVDPDLMGMFEGRALTDGGEELFPPRIFLFLKNIWDEADADPVAFREEVRVTLMHELGHYLGLSESQLIDRDVE